MPHIPVLRQMRRCRGLTGSGDHLVERSPLNKLWVKLLTEFASPAGASIKAFHYYWINMFHEAFSWELKMAGS